MKKLKINLNPKKLTIFEQGFASVLNYLPLLILLVVFFSLVIGGIKAISLARTRQQSYLERSWQEWEPKYDQITSIKRRVSFLENQQEKLKKITSPKKTGIILLESVFFALPKNIWLEDFYFEDKLVQMKGYVVRWEQDSLASLEEFIGRLRAKKEFKEKFQKIDFKTRKTDFRGREVTQFFIECKK